MLSVLLKILAVIGIVILLILGLVLFLILIVLFVPITYKIRGQITDSQKDASVKVKWLFGIIRFTLDYTGELTYSLKVLWFDLTGLLNGSGKKDKTISETANVESASSDTAESDSKKESDPSKEAHSKKDAHLTQTSNSSNDSEPNKNSEPIINSDTTPNTESHKNSIPNADTTASESAAQASDNSDKTTDPEAETPPKESISDKANNLIFKIQSICDKIKGIWKNISYYINLLKEDDTKGLIAHCLKVILNILKSIRPRKLTLDAIIGFDSPDTTGKVYGYLCMLYPYYGDAIHITPDFEKQIISGKVFCSGRIFICVLVLNALRILFDRKLFKVIHKLKNGGKQNGR